MPYNREQWVEKSFQVINDNGAIRSGYFPTGEGLVDGNIAIDRAWGNFPIQPNEDRVGEGAHLLNAGDSHSIALTEWNSYPGLAVNRNYMVTDVEYLPGVTINGQNNIYEYTSQNTLKVGDVVDITNAGWGNSTSRTVLYADATKFRTTDELGEGKLTGLRGRVDVLDSPGNYTGRTLEGGDAFYWPAVGLCNTWGIEENRFQTVAKELIACGVPESWLTDAQWTGGDHSYDDENGTYDTDSGRVFYYYVEPGYDFGYDSNNVKYYGADFDGTVIYGSDNPGVEGDVAAKSDFYLVVFQSHTPGLETADWL